jgi:type 1 glutamine amidotransferase
MPMGGSMGMPSGGAPGTSGAPGTAGTAPTGGTGGAPEIGPYSPRTGSFKMLAYSATKAFRHDESIGTGKTMLTEIAKEQGFELTLTEANTEITPEGLAKYEILFFMNPTGDIFNETQQKTFEDWMTQKNGAFAGTHSATDTENNWAFYKEVTGQYYDLHDPCCSMANIQWDPEQSNFIAVKGLPSPWQRSEEWYKFNSAQTWTSKPGFKVLGRVTTNGGGTRPVSYIREWGNFRAFYTSIGHEGVAFRDANVKKHVAAGIMWAVRREAMLK